MKGYTVAIRSGDLGLTPLGGKSQRYQTASGESISRRQRDRLVAEAREREAARQEAREELRDIPRGADREAFYPEPDIIPGEPSHEGIFETYYAALEEHGIYLTREEAYSRPEWQRLEDAWGYRLPEGKEARREWADRIVSAMDYLSDYYDIEWDMDDWDDAFGS